MADCKNKMKLAMSWNLFFYGGGSSFDFGTGNKVILARTEKGRKTNKGPFIE